MSMRPIVSAGLLALMLAGCTSSEFTKQDLAPKMYPGQPRTIVVMPPVNRSAEPDAGVIFQSSVSVPLTNAGYYVYPVWVINDRLMIESIADSLALADSTLTRLKNMSGADAVLTTLIKDWEGEYLYQSGHVSASLTVLLRSTSKGDTLWRFEGSIGASESGSTLLGGLAGAIADAVVSVSGHASKAYRHLVDRAVDGLFKKFMPFGKYHPQYNLDQKTAVEVNVASARDSVATSR